MTRQLLSPQPRSTKAAGRRRAALRLAAASALTLCAAVAAGPLLAETAPPAGALSCSGCHGSDAAAAIPLGHLSADEITAALTAFADGTRSATLMPRIAKGFTPEEIAAIAAWIVEERQ